MQVTGQANVSARQLTLSLADAMRLLAQAGLACAPWVELSSVTPVTKSALSEIAFPVAVKFDSPHLAHKTEAGAVVLGCTAIAEVERARIEVRERALSYCPQAQAGTLFVQQMVGGVAEFLVGLHRDPVVGPVVVIGTGGVLVELFDDVAMRVLPLAESDVPDMLNELRGIRLIDGFRGRPYGHRESLEKLIRRATSLFNSDDTLISLDLNPVIVGEHGVWIVDALVERRAT